MASCQKCGARVTRRRDRRLKCKRCGFQPTGVHLSRSGAPQSQSQTTSRAPMIRYQSVTVAPSER